MSNINITFNIGLVDYDKLQTDADFRAEVKRLLPKAMQETGKAVALEAWKSIEKTFGSNSSQKAEFVRNATENFSKDTNQKRRMEEYLMGRLREGKAVK